MVIQRLMGVHALKQATRGIFASRFPSPGCPAGQKCRLRKWIQQGSDFASGVWVLSAIVVLIWIIQSQWINNCKKINNSFWASAHY